MIHLNASHYLKIYEIRLRMQEEGITNPPEEIKALVREIVHKLSRLPADEPISLEQGCMTDSAGNMLVKFPESNS